MWADGYWRPPPSTLLQPPAQWGGSGEALYLPSSCKSHLQSPEYNGINTME